MQNAYSSLKRLILSGSILVGLFTVHTAQAQTGTLAGTIVDSEYGDPLPGANVRIEGPLIGSATDFDGKYLIENIEPGTYDVVFSFVGYQVKTVQGVQITAGQTETLDITLLPEALQIEGEVVIEAEAVRNAEGILLRDRQKAAAVSDAISAEAISRSGSSTAGDAMKKVTGASIVGGKYVYVRGLGDRYINTQLNGADLPSADPDRNAVPLDLFPAGLLDNIVTAKTFTPDKPGSFSGGTVDIGTKSFPEAFSLSISSSTSYNSEVTLQDGIQTHMGDPINWLGISDFKIPSMLGVGVEIPNVGEAFTDPEAAARLDELSNTFATPFATGVAKPPLNQSYGLSVGNQVQVLGRPLGVVGSLSYARNSGGYQNGVSSRYQLSGKVSEVNELTNDFMLKDQKGTEEILVGGLVNLSYKIHPRHELGVNYIYNQSGETEARYQIGAFPRDLAANATYETRVLRTVERNLNSLQFRGKHTLDSNGRFQVDWNSSVATSTQDEPDLRYFTNNFTETNGTIRYAIRPSIYPVPNRYFRDLTEDSQTHNLNLTIPFQQWNGLTAKFKTGGTYVKKERSFRERRFEFRQDRAQYTGDPVAFFMGDNLGFNEAESTDRFFRFGNYIVDATQPSSNYDGDQEIAAAYVMVDMPLLPKLRFVGGVRYETTDIHVESLDEALPQGDLSEKDLLPSAGFTYQADELTNLRLAYGRTLARPTFRELAPYASFNFVGDYIFVGNPDLERTLVDSYDIRLERFPRPGEIYAISGFYKYFRNPIERAINPVAAASNPEVQFRNVDNATVAGLEFEVRKRLDVVAEWLQNFQAGGNLTLAQSNVDIAPDELELIRAFDPDADDSRPLQGQSSYVVNFDVGYSNPLSGTTISLFYNVFGERLSEVSAGGTPNLFEQPRHTLDLTFSQGLPMGFTLKGSAKNILNAEYREIHTFKDREFEKQTYNLGRSFSLGISYGI